MLRFVDIKLGEAGGTECRRCHSAAPETLRDATDVIADIRDAARSWDTSPGPNISLTGAEPFHHPAIAEIVAGAVDVGVKRVRLDSDASALATVDAATAAIDAGVRHLQFTLLGSTAPLHDSLCGTAGAFESTLRGVAAFAEAASKASVPVLVSAHVPVCRHNLRDLPTTVTAAARAGACLVRLALADRRLELPLAAPWIGAACDTGIVNSTWVEVEGMPFGPASGWELHLASIYRPVAGAKTAICGPCPLDKVCGGATQGAGDSVVAVFRPPADADQFAARINRGFEPPASAHD